MFNQGYWLREELEQLGCQHGPHVFLVTLFTPDPGRSQPTTERVPAITRLEREATPIVEINRARIFFLQKRITSRYIIAEELTVPCAVSVVPKLQTLMFIRP